MVDEQRNAYLVKLWCL